VVVRKPSCLLLESTITGYSYDFLLVFLETGVLKMDLLPIISLSASPSDVAMFLSFKFSHLVVICSYHRIEIECNLNSISKSNSFPERRFSFFLSLNLNNNINYSKFFLAFLLFQFAKLLQKGTQCASMSDDFMVFF